MKTTCKRLARAIPIGWTMLWCLGTMMDLCGNELTRNDVSNFFFVPAMMGFILAMAAVLILCVGYVIEGWDGLCAELREVWEDSEPDEDD